MEIKEVKDKNQWERFLLQTPWTPFFQSWYFGEAQRTTTDVRHFGVFRSEKLYMVAQVFVVHARRGTFLQVRHGPVFTYFDKQAFLALISHLKHYAQEQKAWFIRISPLLPAETALKDFLKKQGFTNAPVHNQDAENCLIIDLKQSLDDVFKQFRKNTRNLIRRAEKESITIKQTTSSTDLDIFFDLYRKTVQRSNFVSHKGIREEFAELKKINAIKLFIGYYQKRPMAGSLVVFYGKQAVYHHSGSVPSKVPVNYLLQWEVIKEAKKRGMNYYNLWGVAPENKPNHPWQGLSLFKKGFGGERCDFLHAQDLPLSKLYWLSYLYQKLWSLKRGYGF